MLQLKTLKMKISYRTHPILEKMEKCSLGTMPIHQDDKDFFDLCIKGFRENWKCYLPRFKKSINIVSNSFMQSCEAAKEKLAKLYLDIGTSNDQRDFNIEATYFVGGNAYMIYQHFRANSEDIETAFFAFSKEGMPLMCYVDNGVSFQNGWVSRIYDLETGINSQEGFDFIHRHMINVIIINLFKQYASVETKEFPAGQKVKDIYCNHKNETLTNVTHLDSTWFTNLVKSDAFKVRGHFRLQPKKKDGEWTKELIWINDFQKEGYTAPARKLKEGV